MNLLARRAVLGVALALSSVALYVGFPLSAVKGDNKVGVVDLTKVLAAHPKGASLEKINVKYQSQLKALSATIQSLEKKGALLTSKEKQTLNVAKTDAAALSSKYQKEAAPFLKGMQEELTSLVKTTAEKQGFGIVMDREIAKRVIVYANEKAIDLTDEAIANIKKK
jgi:Skp family chaperone for outer membrane proteins